MVILPSRVSSTGCGGGRKGTYCGAKVAEISEDLRQLKALHDDKNRRRELVEYQVVLTSKFIQKW